MLRVLVASSKGGCGKTTIATHLAAHYAVDGKNTVLVDCDGQGSSRRWCEHRSDLATAVLPIDGQKRSWRDKVPSDAQCVIVDSPAGVGPAEVSELLDYVDAVIVPVLPSPFDLEATEPFLAELASLGRIKRGKAGIGLVANRLRPWTNASQLALAEMKRFPFPIVAQIRDSQGYVVATGLGKSLFDYHSEYVRQHQDDWKSLFRWLKKHG